MDEQHEGTGAGAAAEGAAKAADGTAEAAKAAEEQGGEELREGEVGDGDNLDDKVQEGAPDGGNGDDDEPAAA